MYLKKGLGLYLANQNMQGFWDDVWDEVRDIYDDWRNKKPPGRMPPTGGGTGSGIPKEAWYAIAAVAVIALWPKK